MLSFIRKIVKNVSTSKGAKISLTIWLAAVVILSVFAPGSSDYKETANEGSVKANYPSEVAALLKEESFPSDEGLTTLIVFHQENGLTDEARGAIENFSTWIGSDKKPDNVASALPFEKFPKEVQDKIISEDGTTLLYNVTLTKDLESDVIQDTLHSIEDKWKNDFGASVDLQYEMTGPAAISSDTISLFQNADFVLMFATVALIFVLLIVIYRSPLLAIIPLVIAGIVYGVVDRVIGIFGYFEAFTIESQAISIMLVLLFAVVTDYSLFIFSRYREELHHYESKFKAMGEAIYHVSEPIFFSGGTIILAMLTLFVTAFTPYRSFAPVFTIAVVFILLAGLTLIPALFSLLGRKAFWPSIPKVDKESNEKHRFWGWVGRTVTTHPIKIAVTIGLFLVFGIVNLFSVQFSFNMLKSFPDDMSSRVGFELLEDHYPAGELAPVTVLLENEEEFAESDFEHVQDLQQLLEKQPGIDHVNSEISDEMLDGEADLPRDFLSDDEKVVQFEMILNEDPYDKASLDVVKSLRDMENHLIDNSGLDGVALHYAGQTADQLDVNEMNNHDMLWLFPLVILFLIIVLAFQTRSLGLSLLMMGSIVLSYVATLGLGWLIFQVFMGYDAISYRLPVYAFVFMVALGVDYNIMLVSRIKEFAQKTSWIEAIQNGVRTTGGVISSAGIVLAATFSVLMTQPVQELFLFGFIMALGILLDTFIIRGFFLPAILTLTHRKKEK